MYAFGVFTAKIVGSSLKGKIVHWKTEMTKIVRKWFRISWVIKDFLPKETSSSKCQNGHWQWFKIILKSLSRFKWRQFHLIQRLFAGARGFFEGFSISIRIGMRSSNFSNWVTFELILVTVQVWSSIELDETYKFLIKTDWGLKSWKTIFFRNKRRNAW